MADWHLSLVLLLLGLGGLLSAWLQRPEEAADPPRSASRVAPRLLKPRTPDDCPACRQLPTSVPVDRPARAAVRPWGKVKSRRGAPKRIATQGFACANPSCVYWGVIDAAVHALVGDGCHGQRERIQTFRCQACGATLSARRYTALYRLKTISGRVVEVLAALAEGLDVSAAARVFGHQEATITRWLQRAGRHGEALHQCWAQQLHLSHVQFDEIRTRLRARTAVWWLWLAVDPVSKLIPVLYLGPRTQVAAHTVVHTLRQHLAPDCLPVFSSDGLAAYFYALTAHFGAWGKRVGRRRPQWQVVAGLIYGQVTKDYRRRKLVRVSSRMLVGTPEQFKTALRDLGLSGRLNTAFVERVNLTVRQSVAGLVRRTWSTEGTLPPGPSGMVADLLPLCPPAPGVESRPGGTAGAGREASAAALSPAHAGHGRWTDESVLDSRATPGGAPYARGVGHSLRGEARAQAAGLGPRTGVSGARWRHPGHRRVGFAWLDRLQREPAGASNCPPYSAAAPYCELVPPA